jgi:hypothetical protein
VALFYSRMRWMMSQRWMQQQQPQTNPLPWVPKWHFTNLCCMQMKVELHLSRMRI